MAEYLYSKLASEKVGEVEGGRETQNLAIGVSRVSKERIEWEMQKGAWRAVSGAAKNTGANVLAKSPGKTLAETGWRQARPGQQHQASRETGGRQGEARRGSESISAKALGMAVVPLGWPQKLLEHGANLVKPVWALPASSLCLSGGNNGEQWPASARWLLGRRLGSRTVPEQ